MTCPDNCSCYHDQSWSVNIVECASRSFSQPPAAIPMDATEVYLPGNRFEILGGEKYSDIQNNNNNNELSTKLGQFDVMVMVLYHGGKVYLPFNL